MATLTVSEQLKSQVEAQASAEGFGDVEDYLRWLVDGMFAGGPPEAAAGSDEQLEARLLTRIDGPAVPMDAADFARMRAKLERHLDAGDARP
jgi:hypothetical protein